MLTSGNDRASLGPELRVPEAIRHAAAARLLSELLRVLAAVLLIVLAIQTASLVLLVRRGKTVLYVPEARSLRPISKKEGGRP